MSLSSTEIEAIVRLVVQRLRAATADASQAASSDGSVKLGQNIELPRVASTVAPATPDAANNSAANTLELSELVVAMRTVEGKLQGVQVLRVPPSAVVTPAVRDELRDRKIQLEKAKASQASNITVASPQGLTQGLMLLTDYPFSGPVASREVVQGSGNVQSDICRLAAHINSGGKGALWWSKSPFAAIRSARSNKSLVAIQLPRSEDLLRALSEAEPNVLVLDGPAWSIPQIQALAEQWQGRLQ